MNKIYIDKILDKYWEGTTDLAEEQALKNYFQSGNVAEKHKQFIPLFSFYENQKSITYDPPEDVVPKEESQTTKIRRLTVARFMKYAAVGLILISAFLYSGNWLSQDDRITYVEVESPEQALEITESALRLVGVKIKTAEQSVQRNVSKLSLTNIIKQD